MKTRYLYTALAVNVLFVAALAGCCKTQAATKVPSEIAPYLVPDRSGYLDGWQFKEVCYKGIVYLLYNRGISVKYINEGSTSYVARCENEIAPGN